jgi:hypothetical protein
MYSLEELAGKITNQNNGFDWKAFQKIVKKYPDLLNSPEKAAQLVNLVSDALHSQPNTNLQENLEAERANFDLVTVLINDDAWLAQEINEFLWIIIKEAIIHNRSEFLHHIFKGAFRLAKIAQCKNALETGVTLDFPERIAAYSKNIHLPEESQKVIDAAIKRLHLRQSKKIWMPLIDLIDAMPDTDFELDINLKQRPIPLQTKSLAAINSLPSPVFSEDYHTFPFENNEQFREPSLEIPEPDFDRPLGERDLLIELETDIDLPSSPRLSENNLSFPKITFPSFDNNDQFEEEVLLEGHTLSSHQFSLPPLLNNPLLDEENLSEMDATDSPSVELNEQEDDFSAENIDPKQDIQQLEILLEKYKLVRGGRKTSPNVNGIKEYQVIINRYLDEEQIPCLQEHLKIVKDKDEILNALRKERSQVESDEEKAELKLDIDAFNSQRTRSKQEIIQLIRVALITAQRSQTSELSNEQIIIQNALEYYAPGMVGKKVAKTFSLELEIDILRLAERFGMKDELNTLITEFKDFSDELTSAKKDQVHFSDIAANLNRRKKAIGILLKKLESRYLSTSIQEHNLAKMPEEKESSATRLPSVIAYKRSISPPSLLESESEKTEAPQKKKQKMTVQ